MSQKKLIMFIFLMLLSSYSNSSVTYWKLEISKYGNKPHLCGVIYYKTTQTVNDAGITITTTNLIHSSDSDLLNNYPQLHNFRVESFPSGEFSINGGAPFYCSDGHLEIAEREVGMHPAPHPAMLSAVPLLQSRSHWVRGFDREPGECGDRVPTKISFRDDYYAQNSIQNLLTNTEQIPIFNSLSCNNHRDQTWVYMWHRFDLFYRLFEVSAAEVTEAMPQNMFATFVLGIFIGFMLKEQQSGK